MWRQESISAQFWGDFRSGQDSPKSIKIDQFPDTSVFIWRRNPGTYLPDFLESEIDQFLFFVFRQG